MELVFVGVLGELLVGKHEIKFESSTRCLRISDAARCRAVFLALLVINDDSVDPAMLSREPNTRSVQVAVFF